MCEDILSPTFLRGPQVLGLINWPTCTLYETSIKEGCLGPSILLEATYHCAVQLILGFRKICTREWPCVGV